MLRRSPRLMKKNGHYPPNEPTIGLIQNKKTPVSTIKKRKKSKMSLDNEFNMSDFQNLDSKAVMLASDIPHQQVSLLTRCHTIVKKMNPLALCLYLLGFGFCLGYMCVILYMPQHLAHILQHSGIQDHAILFREIDSLKQIIKDYMIENKDTIHRALSRHRADNIGMTDYALESLGATVLTSSETYNTRYCSLFGFSFWCKNNGPETIIQPEVYPGKCWSFKGSEGNVVISLPYPIRITHVTLQHLPRVLSPYHNISRAPRDFSVYGLEGQGSDQNYLGTFTYDQEGEPIQTFKIPDCPSQLFQLVELRILNNWGHSECTCVYRFRIHSEPS